MKSLLLFTACLAAFSLGACIKSSDAPAKGGDAHAAVDVKPSSHEDWCGEHAVPESQCTRCHPALAAAFKATNDWCEEHGLPESNCLKCNPSLKIVRPPKGS
jgi:hypothetical protein